VRALKVRMEDAQARIDDVYANLTNSPTWTDARSDNPPHLMTPSDVLAWNSFVANMVAVINGAALAGGQTLQQRVDGVSGNYANVVDGCVRSIGA
jgi:hypothetical protein